MVNLPNPEICRLCGARAMVYDTRSGIGYRLRRYQCPTCRKPDGRPARWTSYESVLDVRRIRFVDTPSRTTVDKPERE